jgi:hypothetical protein
MPVNVRRILAAAPRGPARSWGRCPRTRPTRAAGRIVGPRAADQRQPPADDRRQGGRVGIGFIGLRGDFLGHGQVGLRHGVHLCDREVHLADAWVCSFDAVALSATNASTCRALATISAKCPAPRPEIFTPRSQFSTASANFSAVSRAACADRRASARGRAGGVEREKVGLKRAFADGL